MDTLTELQSIPESIPYDVKRKSLLDLVHNIHCYLEKKCYLFFDDLTIVSRTIRNVSLVNKDLYESLKATRNDPIMARVIITNCADDKDDNILYCDTASQFTFPGAIKCLNLTHQLYDENLTPEQLENLFKQGAILDYATTRYHKPQSYKNVLSHWTCITRKNKQQAATLITKLLELGAHCNIDHLSYVIDTKNITCTKIMAPYVTTITNRCWNYASNTGPDYINILFQHSKQKDLDEGLKTCVGTKWWQNSENASISYNPEGMQQFIDAGANTSIALNHLVNELSKIKMSMHDNNDPVYQNLIFLSEHGAFDQTALNKLKKIRNTFNSLISAVEKNNPH
jgi:hypothetical protein